VRVEGGDGDVHEPDLSNEPVAAAGLDQDAGQRAHRVQFAVEDEINLGELFVVVRPGVRAASTRWMVATGLSGVAKARRDCPQGQGTGGMVSRWARAKADMGEGVKAEGVRRWENPWRRRIRKYGVS
jgi:hypothetical protein